MDLCFLSLISIVVRKLVTDQAKKPNHIHISSTIPLDVLNDLIADRQTSLLEVTFSQSLVDASKLKGFLQINEVAGIALNPKDTQQMLAFLPAADLYKLSNHKDNIGLSAHQFCAIYIQHLPLQPVRSLTYSPNPNHLSFSWEKISQLLLFPPQLKKIKSEAKFFVYGHSRIANLLSKAISRTRKITNPKAHVMMFDRGSSVLLSRTLTRHKKEPLSQLWEFGAPEKEVTRIQPPEQVFPNFSGGFVTTDIENILKNPKILDTICDQIQILNRDTVLNGHWKFVLPHTIFLQLQKAGKSYQNVQDAVIKLSLVFSSKSASALKLWSLDSQELDTVQFMEATLQNYYKTHRFFVYVDDIRSVQSERRPFCLDFVESSNIVSAFT
ncbi:hypothetical protein BY458DRAFT_166259 [Sporodiniella umbellata]|nr:hypothetical protein BY458DRAFT_166259 [Sporodiniella umbellata]